MPTDVRSFNEQLLASFGRPIGWQEHAAVKPDYLSLTNTSFNCEHFDKKLLAFNGLFLLLKIEKGYKNEQLLSIMICIW